jgi:hypothetical protein
MVRHPSYPKLHEAQSGPSVVKKYDKDHIVQKFKLTRPLDDKFESGGGKVDLFHLN